MMPDQTDVVRAAHPRRDIPGESPEVARLSAMIVALVQEFSITRERLDTVERVAQDAGAFTRAAVEDYRPADDAEHERNALRARLIAVVMHPLKADAERAAQAARRPVDLDREADEILAKEQAR